MAVFAEKAIVMGVSQGGMIAQYLAASHGELVEKLVQIFRTANSQCQMPNKKSTTNSWQNWGNKMLSNTAIYNKIIML